MLAKMSSYVLHGIAVAGVGPHSLSWLLDPHSTNQATAVRFDKIQELGAEAMSLTSLVAGGATGHLENFASLDLHKDVVESVARCESPREMLPLQREEVPSNGRNGGGFYDKSNDHHHRSGGGAAIGCLVAA
jgi:hypothetical protein